MRRPDEYPDDRVLATLEVIDATLAGEPVDPEHAELAELALILADEGPRPAAEFASRLDQRVHERFEARARSRPWRRLAFAPAAVVALVFVIVAGVVLSSGGNGAPVRTALPERTSSSASSAGGGAITSSAGSGVPKTLTTASSSAAASSPAAAQGAAAVTLSAVAPNPAPTPAPNGRRVVQSAQLSLSTTPGRIEQVAQQVFDVVGAAKGDVSHSTVTAAGGTGGFADFQLSVPSATLPQTMAQLSRLRGANVVSRTDATQDITGSFVSVNRRLADARALRTALLRQLSSAVTTQQVDSLRARIRDAEASIASDLATLGTLRRQVGHSQISITISTAAPAPPRSAGGGFTLGRAAHDAGRVLTVAAGVALIVLAVLVPISALAAIIAFGLVVARRRRREQALDLA
jgi:pyruvate/2-oxoglutarate dehydrogenase complex dihydrolipoamide acyltransferase (E2) component